MNMTKERQEIVLRTADGDGVPCLCSVPEDPTGIVIILHGFGSNKESVTAEMLLRILPEAGLGAIAFDFPAHGTGESRDVELRLETCFAFLHRVEQYVWETYPGVEIGYFASSFGAYINLLYLSRGGFAGKKAFLRSAAVNMPELFLGGDAGAGPNEEFKRMLEQNQSVTLSEGFPNPVRVPLWFFVDLQSADLFTTFDAAAIRDIPVIMVHGEDDRTIPVARARAFASNFGIPIHVWEGEDHTLSTNPETPKQVMELAVQFFQAEQLTVCDIK